MVNKTTKIYAHKADAGGNGKSQSTTPELFGPCESEVTLHKISTGSSKGNQTKDPTVNEKLKQ